MTPKVAEILRSALALSLAEREELADCLWASLDPSDAFAGQTEEDWIAELERRAAELKADPSQGVAWDEVRDMR